MLARKYYLRTVFFWIVTVIVGSLISGLIAGLIIDSGTSLNIDDFFYSLGIASYSAFFSLIISLPVLLIYFLVKLWFENTNNQYRFWIVNVIHLLGSIITFSILIYFEAEAFKNYMYVCAIVYTSIGQLLWNLDFRMKNERVKKIRSSLDVQF